MLGIYNKYLKQTMFLGYYCYSYSVVTIDGTYIIIIIIGNL
jgi:hypothetical protein